MKIVWRQEKIILLVGIISLLIAGYGVLVSLAQLLCFSDGGCGRSIWSENSLFMFLAFVCSFWVVFERSIASLLFVSTIWGIIGISIQSEYMIQQRIIEEKKQRPLIVQEAMAKKDINHCLELHKLNASNRDTWIDSNNEVRRCKVAVFKSVTPVTLENYHLFQAIYCEGITMSECHGMEFELIPSITNDIRKNIDFILFSQSILEETAYAPLVSSGSSEQNKNLGQAYGWTIDIILETEPQERSTLGDDGELKTITIQQPIKIQKEYMIDILIASVAWNTKPYFWDSEKTEILREDNNITIYVFRGAVFARVNFNEYISHHDIVIQNLKDILATF